MASTLPRDWKASPSPAPSVSPRTPIGRLSRGSISSSAIWRDPTQEHRRAGPGLFARSRQAGAGEADQARRTKAASNFPLLGAGIVALIVIAGSAWYFLGANRPATVTSNAPAARADAAHLSIVVLPFTNLSGDRSEDYFADGMTENLTTDLSRIRNSFAIGRNTAFTFKGKNIDSKEISKELGVCYVLEGSVQRDQKKCASTHNLLMPRPAHLWADRFEEDITDLFKLQDQVVARLANSLGYELAKAEAQNKHPLNQSRRD